MQDNTIKTEKILENVKTGNVLVIGLNDINLISLLRDDFNNTVYGLDEHEKKARNVSAQGFDNIYNFRANTLTRTFEPNSFDTIIFNQSLSQIFSSFRNSYAHTPQHLVNYNAVIDIGGVMQQVYTILKKNGKVIILDGAVYPNAESVGGIELNESQVNALYEYENKWFNVGKSFKIGKRFTNNNYTVVAKLKDLTDFMFKLANEGTTMNQKTSRSIMSLESYKDMLYGNGFLKAEGYSFFDEDNKDVINNIQYINFSNPLETYPNSDIIVVGVK